MAAITLSGWGLHLLLSTVGTGASVCSTADPFRSDAPLGLSLLQLAAGRHSAENSTLLAFDETTSAQEDARSRTDIADESFPMPSLGAPWFVGNDETSPASSDATAIDRNESSPVPALMEGSALANVTTNTTVSVTTKTLATATTNATINSTGNMASNSSMIVNGAEKATAKAATRMEGTEKVTANSTVNVAGRENVHVTTNSAAYLNGTETVATANSADSVAASTTEDSIANEMGAAREEQEEPVVLDEIFMRYMPEKNVIVCGCAKCGTSSMYEYIYQKEFGASWAESFGGTKPYIHQVDTKRWQGKFRMVHDPAEQDQLMQTAFSFSIIRDPQERLISAWKSKIACGCGGETCVYHTDVGTRPMMVGKLLELAGWDKSTAKCLDLDVFLRVLNEVHKRKQAHLLDRHFLPIDMGCFFRFPPSKWSEITSVARTNAFGKLATHIGPDGSTDAAIPPAAHASQGKVLLDAESVALLDEITATEYSILGPSLAMDRQLIEQPHWQLKPDHWALFQKNLTHQ